MPTFYNFTKNDIFGNLFPNITSAEAFRIYGDRSTFTGSNTYTISSQVSPFNSNSCSVFIPSFTNIAYLSTENNLSTNPPFSRNSNVITRCQSPRVYQISFYIKGITYPVGCAVRGDVGWQDPDGNGFSPSLESPDVNLNGSWQYVNFTRTIAAGSNILTTFQYGSLEIILLEGGTFTNTEVLISDIKVTDSTITDKTSFDDQFIPADTFRQGNLWSSGQIWNGRLADGRVVTSTEGSTTAVLEFTKSSNWRTVSTSIYHGAGIKDNGSLWTWGTNNYGSIGDNSVQTKLTPVPVIGSNNNWVKVSCGSIFMCAIKADGTLWCWGRNTEGELGINDNIDRRTPVQEFTSGTNWKDVSCSKLGNSEGFVLALKSDGTIWSWGRNNEGQLGVNDNIIRSTPVQEWSSSTNWKSISTGAQTASYAIKTDGTLWTWGYNQFGQLSTFDTISRSTPVQEFSSSTNWKQVSGGFGHWMAIKNDGTLWGAGNGSFGVLATNLGISFSSPIQEFTSRTNWKKISCGDFSSAIQTNGTLWGWGTNTYGQLADGLAYTSTLTPRQEQTLSTNWKDVATGNSHRSAIKYIDPII
jgi:alpha-tubulin suppressor-like RCC1 family protein